MTDEKFSELVKQYQGLIISICHRYVKDFSEAENLTQETFLSAYKARDGFDGDSYKAWLVKIATNKCLDFLRKPRAKREECVEDEQLVRLIGENSGSAENEAVSKQTVKTIETLCQNLKEPYSCIAYMYYIQQLSFAEIAKRRSVPVKTVQTQLYRARDKLRVEIKEVLNR